MAYLVRPLKIRFSSWKLSQRISLVFGCLGLLWGQIGIAQEVENSLLWEISKPKSKHTSYLYGTIHLIPKDSFFVLPALNRVIKKTDRLVLEMNLDEAMSNPLNLLTRMQSALALPDGKQLTDLFTAEEMEEIRASVSENDLISAESLNTFSPMLLAVMLESDGCSGQDKTATTSYELYLSKRYKDNFLPIVGLETLDDQLGFFGDIPLESQAAYLLATVRDKSSNCDKMAELVATYRRQEIGKLLQNNGLLEGDQDITSVLLDERNKRWIPTISKLTRKEDILIAVGAGHLPGPNGLLVLLREAGYVVTAVNH